MDNQHERAGWWRDRFSQGVDLNCYLVRELRAMARLAGWLGQANLALDYLSQAERRAAAVRSWLWDEQDGFFYDRNARRGEPLMSQHAGWASTLNGIPVELIRVKAVSGFAALWAGVATAEQARRMVLEHLFNLAEFWTANPLPALAKSERWYSRDWLPGDLGCNWRAKTWIPTNYMIYHGLRRYGYDQLASLVAHHTLRLLKTAGNREYYDAETGEGCGLDPFWGWSLLGYFLPYEELGRFDLTSLE
jgi:neutral trehalase